MQYNFNLNTLIGWIVPTPLKKSKFLAWLKALNKPVKFIYARFLEHEIISRQEIFKNGQVIVLQRTLEQYANQNGGFSPALPVIEEGEDDSFDYGDTLPEVSFFFNSNKIFVEDYPFNVALPSTVKIVEKLIDNDIVMSGLIEEIAVLPSCLISETETPYDFQVRVHESLIKDLSLKTLRSVVDKYKVIGRTYFISIYN